MGQVSRKVLHKDVEKRIAEIFVDTILRLKTTYDVQDFLDDFLSPVEKIMLSKRLAIAVLLEKGYSYESISDILHVTPSTISIVSVRLKYSGKGYKKMVEMLLRDEKTSEFWEKVEDLLSNIPASKGSSIIKQKKARREKKLANKKPF